MIDYKDFYTALTGYKILDPIYTYLLSLIEEQISERKDKEAFLIVFAVYFSLLSEGNVCISLDQDTLKKKWRNKLLSTRVLLESDPSFDEAAFDEIESESMTAISNVLLSISESELPEIVGPNRIFSIDNGWLYLMKYELARLSIIESIKRLYSYKSSAQNVFDLKGTLVDGFKLSSGQEKAITIGLNQNLIITGGPGTGKTTSILFLLLNLLSADKDLSVYLVAPSGKASSRMKESIINGLRNLNEQFVSTNKELVAAINNLQESTIHRLLGIDQETKAFQFNKEHQFSINSLFVIDEASMIDICLFDSLLSAIPTGARVFMMGDKNQLPSVESGAVFSDLLKRPDLKSNIIELDESIRFGADTKIYELAASINTGGPLPVHTPDWKNAEGFSIQPNSKEKPIFYYTLREDCADDKGMDAILCEWGNKYIASLQQESTSIGENHHDLLDRLFDKTEEAKILCAENEGRRGIKTINSWMIKNYIDRTVSSSVDGYFPGELIMITKNNKMLDLYNGDSGILVTFEGDKTLYLMVKKASQIVENDGKERDKIFKLGSYVFYPFRMISSKEITFAYAITIHKSQGSDYQNILVILPRQKGHPLVNRQIVYTAITRTKGNTYIVSSQEVLEKARDTVIVRDTNVA